MEQNSYINFLNEVGMLSLTPRSGFAFLGSGKQSVAEHSFRMALTGFVLADMAKEKVDRSKLILMCLLHDLPEARTGDLNYVNKKYVKADERKVLEEYATSYPCGKEISELILEYIEAQTIEAKLAHDADQLELMLVLKQESEKGNLRALEWYDRCLLRLKTKAGKALGQKILTVPSNEWWSHLTI